MNPQEIWMNLQIMDLAKQWPGQFQALHDRAKLELEEANDEAKEEIAARTEAKAKKVAAEKAEAARLAQAQAEAEAKAQPKQNLQGGTLQRPDFAPRPETVVPPPPPVARRPE